MKRNIAHLAFPWLIALLLGGLYIRTVSPGLTWAFDGADGGDFLAAIATGGVPHPGGYPTYILLASAFAKIPVGSLAFRTNLFSAVCMALAVFLFHKLVQSLTGSHYAASLSSILFGTFPLVWSQALITEVYALQALLSVLILLLLVSKYSSPLRGFGGGFVLGTAMGNHLTSLFFLPLIFFDNIGKIRFASGTEGPLRDSKPYFQLVLTRLAGTCLGLATYLIIPFRAQSQAPVNWGNAVTWDSFWWLVSGEMYHGRLGNFSAAYLYSSLQVWSRFMLEQAGVVGLSVSLLALVMLFKRSPLFYITSWLFLVWSAFAIVYYSPDSYVYLIPPLMSVAIWIGLGANFVFAKLPLLNLPLRLFLMSLPFALAALRVILVFPEMDLSQDHKAEQYAQSILTSLPPEAIVITRGDEAMFSLWYFHYANSQRPDVAVVSNDLLSQPWYHDVLKYTYPDLGVPDGNQAETYSRLNPQRPVCLLSANLQPQFTCLP